MEMTVRELKDVLNKHERYAREYYDEDGQSEVYDALDLVSDLLEAEAQYIRTNEPYATTTIANFENAERAVRGMLLDLMYIQIYPM